MTQARGLDAVRAHLGLLGVTSRRHRAVLTMLREPATLAALVDATALSRRAIEALLRLAGPDVERAGDTYRLVAPGYDELGLPAGAPLTWAGREDGDLVERLRPLVAGAPPPVKHLDHVPATPESVARRATWMADELWLPGATVAFVGDHDLTSVALALVEPDVRIVVVDLDARLLGYLRTLTPAAALHHLDLRDPLPDELHAVADVFVTDPPYTPTGAALFVARGLAMLRGGVHARGLVAYGYGEELPTLGLKVQRAVTGLEVVLEQVLPRFGRYVGAQAVGSASAWYVLAPTPRTARAVARFVLPDERIYTHGRQSLEAAPTVRSPVADPGRWPGSATDRPEAPVPAMPVVAGQAPAVREPAAVLAAALSGLQASTVRAAAIVALAKGLRAAGARPTREQVRAKVEAALPVDGVMRMADLDGAGRAMLEQALTALLPR